MCAVYTKNVTITQDTEAGSVQLLCAISGFDNNIPEMEYGWKKDDKAIPVTAEKYQTSVMEDSPGVYKLKIFEPSMLLIC